MRSDVEGCLRAALPHCRVVVFGSQASGFALRESKPAPPPPPECATATAAAAAAAAARSLTADVDLCLLLDGRGHGETLRACHGANSSPLSKFARKEEEEEEEGAAAGPAASEELRGDGGAETALETEMKATGEGPDLPKPLQGIKGMSPLSQEICRNFNKGRCALGDECLRKHEAAPTEPSKRGKQRARDELFARLQFWLIGAARARDGMSTFAEVKAITTAKVPILKCVHTATGVAVDICVDNVLAVHNSRLLRAYAAYDGRVLALGLLVKRWAKAVGVASSFERTLSSYCWVLLVVHFCQVVGIVPCLQSPSLREKAARHPPYPPAVGPFEQVHGVEVDVGFVSGEAARRAHDDGLKPPAAGSASSASLGALLLGFFKYYALDMPYLLEAMVVHRVGRQVKAREPARLWSRAKWLSIRDPFDFDHDLGVSLSEDGWRRVWTELRWAHDTLLMTGNCPLVIYGGPAGQPRQFMWRPTPFHMFGRSRTHVPPAKVVSTTKVGPKQQAAEMRRWKQWEELQQARAAAGEVMSLQLPVLNSDESSGDDDGRYGLIPDDEVVVESPSTPEVTEAIRARLDDMRMRGIEPLVGEFGDWMCPQCNAMCFDSKAVPVIHCYKCGKTKPGAEHMHTVSSPT